MGCHRNETFIGGKGTSGALDDGSISPTLDMAVGVALVCMLFQMMAVAMFRVAWRQEEQGGGAHDGVDLNELHGEIEGRFSWPWEERERIEEGVHGRRRISVAMRGSTSSASDRECFFFLEGIRVGEWWI